MGGSNVAAKPSKKEVERAEAMWENFMTYSKAVIVVTSVVLLALALIFVG